MNARRGRARQRAGLLYARCWWYARLGRYEEALACAQQQAAINREGGDPVGEQAAMANVASMELLLGRPDAALEHGRAAIARLDASAQLPWPDISTGSS